MLIERDMKAPPKALAIVSVYIMVVLILKALKQLMNVIVVYMAVSVIWPASQELEICQK